MVQPVFRTPMSRVVFEPYRRDDAWRSSHAEIVSVRGVRGDGHRRVREIPVERRGGFGVVWRAICVPRSEPEVLDGESTPERVAIIEFDSPARVREFYDWPAYQAILPFTVRSTKGHVLLLTGGGGGLKRAGGDRTKRSISHNRWPEVNARAVWRRPGMAGSKRANARS